MLKESEKTFALLQRIIDSTIILIAWLIAYYVRFNFIPDGQQGLFLDFFKVGLILIPISLYFFDKFELYKSQRFSSRFIEILNTLKANFFSFIALIVILYFLKFERLSRIHLAIYFSISSTILLVTRITIRNFLRTLRAKGKNLRHVLLVGDGKNIENYYHAVKKYKDSGISFMGWIDPPSDTSIQVEKITQSYDEYSKNITPDSIILSYDSSSIDKQKMFLQKNYNDIVPIQLLPDLSFSLVGHQIEEFAGIPILTFNQPSFSSFELFLKRLFDFLASLMGLLIISPFMLMLSIGVKLSSPGPIFYGQERVGINGRKFNMWKFRSMRVANDNEDQTTWSSKEDPRKTKFGSFIRSTSLDELPQLWNVLIGDMSLVGPRPERTFFVEKFKNEIPNYMLRHKMKAGITGWAQVNGWRGDTDLSKRIECDIYYIRNWSLILDFKILLLTFVKGFINKNAY
ncbi:putative UDP-glucose lipid carrier transferase [Halobacteriovorax marinus SJ]|uniref:UDP-glucose lipid carrier transferase n=1 Tax=Halobacteriovorax marinus (strain ATCC BAA-682 / DSM 15412 / SJ) TaxID=862908 RepID=E1X3V5_HALMS|nr:undecaprenyl-phosphate glucose phosphotransferase [Halobacteriovorax marinus]CBW25295.1 putative UDP-glucose lipid carrier transferase [Halobacteriovorax marinus SJ]